MQIIKLHFQILFLIIWVSIIPAIAQENFFFENLFSTKIDTVSFDSTYKKINFLVESNPAAAMISADSLLEIVKSTNDQKRKAKIYSLKSNIAYELNDFDVAHKNIDIAISAFETQGDAGALRRCYNMKGILNYKENDLEGAVNNYFKALQAAQESGNKKAEAQIRLNIGLIYLVEGDFGYAKEHYDAAKGVALDLKDEVPLLRANSSILMYYIYKKDCVKVIEVADEALEKVAFNQKDSFGKKEVVCSILINKAYFLNSIDKPNEALLSLEKLMGLFPDSCAGYSECNLLSSVCINLSQTASQMGDFKTADLYLNKSDSIRKLLGNHITDLGKSWLLTKSSSLELRGDYKAALEKLKEYSELNDSLNKLYHDKNLLDLQQRYEVKQKDKALTIAKQSNRIKTLQNFVLGFIILLTVLLTVFVFRKYKKARLNRMKAEESIEIQRGLIENKNRELVSNSAQLAENSSLKAALLNKIDDVKKKVGFENVTHLYSLEKFIQDKLGDNNNWEVFLKHFQEVHPHFFEVLDKNNGDLSIYEKRLCSYIKMNLGNKEIAQIFNIQPNSIKMAKNRLKKKLGLPKTENLDSFLSSV